MIDQIAIWTSRHHISFAEYAAMVSVWSSDCDYWSAQPLPRLYAEAIGAKSPMVSKTLSRV